jgi:hypothetical protein
MTNKKYQNPSDNPRLYPPHKEYVSDGLCRKNNCKERYVHCIDCGELGHARFFLDPDNPKRKCVAVAHRHFTRDMDKYRNANHIVKEPSKKDNGKRVIIWYDTKPGEVVRVYRLKDHKPRGPSYVWDMFED